MSETRLLSAERLDEMASALDVPGLGMIVLSGQDLSDIRSAIAMARALTSSAQPRQWDEEHEARAKAIYDAMPYDGPRSKPAWVPHGNSRKQDEARDLARLPTPSPQ